MGKYEPYVKTDLRDTIVSELDKLTDWLYEEGIKYSRIFFFIKYVIELFFLVNYVLIE